MCSKCGVVHDRLTSLEVAGFREYLYKASEEKHNRPRGTRTAKIVSSGYKYAVRLYRVGSRLTKGRPWLEVDYEKVFRSGKFVHSIRSRASLKAAKNIELGGCWGTVKRGLEYVDSVNPAYLARSERGKYALAYIVARRLETGRIPKQDEVLEVFNISIMSYKRLCAIAERLVRGYLSA